MSKCASCMRYRQGYSCDRYPSGSMPMEMLFGENACSEYKYYAGHKLRKQGYVR